MKEDSDAPDKNNKTKKTKASSAKQTKKYSKLTDYLIKHRHSKKDQPDLQPTHTRIGDESANIYGGSYYISDEDYSEFMKLYFEEVVQKKGTEYLTEKQLPDEFVPIAIDLDLHFAFDVKERLYEDDHITDLIDLYLEEMKKALQFEENSSFPIFIFEKPHVNPVEEKQITKDGLHIIIGVNMSRTGQKILRKNVMKEIANVWTDLPIINSWEEVFDDGITNGYTNWQLYGSCKPHHETYQLTKAYEITYDSNDGEFETNENDVNDYLTPENFSKLSVRYKGHEQYFYTSAFANEIQKFENGDTNVVRKSISPKNVSNTREYKLEDLASVNEIASIQNEEQLKMHIERFLEITTQRHDYYLRELYETVMVLPSQYYETGSYAKWIRVGWALKNSSLKLLIAWIAFSARASNFDYSTIHDLCVQWETFVRKDGGVSSRSIHFWAKTDNNTDYLNVRQNTVLYYLDQTINSVTSSSLANKNAKGAGDFDIATVLYQMYKDEYVCTDIQKGIWWRFKNHRWHQIDSGTHLRKAISVQLRDLYSDRCTELQNYLSSLDSEDEKYKPIKGRIETIMKIVLRLACTADKKNIMQESKDLFYDNEFYERLDSDPYLLGVKNGVVDMKNKIFRKGRPDDYITKCTKVNYFPLSSSKHAKYIPEIHDFMSKIFPVQDIRDYMWEHLSACLIGMPSLNQTFNNYTGDGQNGKSVLTDLMARILGTYKVAVPCSLITQGRGKIGGTAPEVVLLKGARYAVMQEPETKEELHEGPMKELVSGVEPITARGLYMSEPTTFVPQFTLVLCCNNLLPVKSQDHGTWRRFRIVPFQSLFTEKPVHDDPLRPYQFKLDSEIMKKFDGWSETFLTMLVEKAFVNQGRVKDCEAVLCASKEYREREDYLAQFAAEKLLVSQGSVIKKAQVSEEFKLWYGVNFGGKPPSPKGLHEYIDKKFGRNKQGLWKNVRLKYHHEEDESTDSDDEEGIAVSEL
tara:strand:+ start:806 stop:3736 length:2931 start_codon:yes stop_codon:yes gene_type:complete